MNDTWAAENLQTIRTLMERAAVYRRALAPITLTTGVVGAVAGVTGWTCGLSSTRGLISFWLAVAVLALAVGLLMVRRQAMRDAEPFWSPPTRRVAQAMLPSLFIGLVAGLVLLLADDDAELIWALVPLWMALYGSALLAAGFFMARSVKVVGAGFLGAGTLLICALIVAQPDLNARLIHAVMGAAFGGIHLAYGAYLYFTERKPTKP